MSGIEILKTEDYDLFKFDEYNRQLNQNNLKNILASMKEIGFEPSKFITVNYLYKIYDGQHRYRAAQILSLPIYYHIDTSLPSSFQNEKKLNLINSSQKNWVIDDYINNFRENKNVRTLIELNKIYNINFNVLCKLFVKNFEGHKKRLGNIFSAGIEFNIPLNEIFDFLDYHKKFIQLLLFPTKNKKRFFAMAFMIAFYDLYNYPEIELDYLLSKLYSHITNIPITTDRKYMRKTLVDIYNFGKKINKIKLNEKFAIVTEI